MFVYAERHTHVSLYIHLCYTRVPLYTRATDTHMCGTHSRAFFISSFQYSTSASSCFFSFSHAFDLRHTTNHTTRTHDAFGKNFDFLLHAMLVRPRHKSILTSPRGDTEVRACKGRTYLAPACSYSKTFFLKAANSAIIEACKGRTRVLDRDECRRLPPMAHDMNIYLGIIL